MSNASPAQTSNTPKDPADHEVGEGPGRAHDGAASPAGSAEHPLRSADYTDGRSRERDGLSNESDRGISELTSGSRGRRSSARSRTSAAGGAGGEPRRSSAAASRVGSASRNSETTSVRQERDTGALQARGARSRAASEESAGSAVSGSRAAAASRRAMTATRLSVGDEAPNFRLPSQVGPFNFYEYSEGSWVLLFSHPADYTPVCASEVIELQRMAKDFSARNCKIVGLSVDPTSVHESWVNDLKRLHDVRIRYPIVSDEAGVVARQYGMLHPSMSGEDSLHASEGSERAALPVRAVILIDVDKRIQIQMAYPVNTGRNWSEVLRSLDAIQCSTEYEVATPANWEVGDDVLVLPSMDDEEAHEHFPKGFVTIKPFLRLAPMPGM